MKKVNFPKTVSLTCFALLLFLNLHAQNAIQLIKENTGNASPLLVVNVPSNDCIMCRGSVLNLLDQIEHKDKTIVLFDDRVMQLFVDKYPEKFKGYKLLFDKELSNILTPDQISAAYIITDTGMRKFIIKTIAPESIELLNNALATTGNGETTYTFNVKPAANNPNYSNITYFNGLGNGGFIADTNSSLLFNDHVQVGYYYEAGNEPVFMEPQELTLTESRLLPLVQERYHLRLVPDTLKDLALSTTAISPIVLMGMENHNGEISSVIRLNIVRNKSPEGDTNITLGITGYYFLGTGASSIAAPLSPARYPHYYLLDTFHLNNECYQASPMFGCYKAGNKAYFQVLEAEPNGAVKKQRRHHLAEVLIDEHKTAPVLLKLYKMETYDKNPTENLLFTCDDEGYPLVIYKNIRLAHYYKTQKEIPFGDLLAGQYPDAILYDVYFEKGKIISLFLQDSSMAIVSAYDVKKGKADLKTFPIEKNYEGGKFVGNNLRLFRKDAQKGLYTFTNIKYL